MNYQKCFSIALATIFISANLAKDHSDNERHDSKGFQPSRGEAQKESHQTMSIEKNRHHSENHPRIEKPNAMKTTQENVHQPEKVPIQQRGSQIKSANKTPSSIPSLVPSITRTPAARRTPHAPPEGQSQPIISKKGRSFAVPSFYNRHNEVREHTKDANKPQTFSTQRQHDNREAANRVKDRVRNAYPHHHRWFNHEFFHHHRFRADYYNAANNWWRTPQWGAVTYWLGANWAYPLDYTEVGYPAEILVDGNDVAAHPDITGDWLPLGVFAAGRTEEQAAFSSMFIQLVVNKEGDVAGAYYNATTDETHPIAGMVNEETQEVLWKVSDNPDSPLMVTGIFNLTQDVANVQVFFPDDTEQTWTLVRIN